jgi:hypothetical protein
MDQKYRLSSFINDSERLANLLVPERTSNKGELGSVSEKE